MDDDEQRILLAYRNLNAQNAVEISQAQEATAGLGELVKTMAHEEDSSADELLVGQGEQYDDASEALHTEEEVEPDGQKNKNIEWSIGDAIETKHYSDLMIQNFLVTAAKNKANRRNERTKRAEFANQHPQLAEERQKATEKELPIMDLMNEWMKPFIAGTKKNSGPNSLEPAQEDLIEKTSETGFAQWRKQDLDSKNEDPSRLQLTAMKFRHIILLERAEIKYRTTFDKSNFTPHELSAWDLEDAFRDSRSV